MNTSRYQPWLANAATSNDFRSALERFFSIDDGDQSNVVTSQWAPQVDISEEDGRFVIFADIPGVDPSDIEVHMDKGILSIKGERHINTSENNGKFTRVERSHGIFHRRFALPDSADADKISARGSHGVLEISLPKKAETTPRRIVIES